jgi:energy-coupling factor transport system permease protein
VVKSQNLYSPGDSLLHRLHPFTKLFFSLASVAVIFTGPEVWISAILPGLLALLLLWKAGLAWQVLKTISRLLFPLIIALILIHGLFNPINHTIIFSFWGFSMGLEGLLFAALIVTRLAMTLSVSLLLMVTTPPAHLIQAFQESGLPFGLAYLFGSPLLLIPQLTERVQVIQSAQQARGLEIQGTILQRIRAFFPLVAPLIFGSLVDVEDRSLALEVRGFSAPFKKTHFVELADSRSQRIIRFGLVLAAGIISVIGFFWRANGGH